MFSKIIRNYSTAGFIYLFLVIVSSCELTADQREKQYFDLDGYFTEEIKRLEQDSLNVIKTSIINGKSDQHQMKWVDWNKELTLFLASDINKPAFEGKYVADSLYSDGDEWTIQYSAADSSLRTRLIEIEFRLQEVTQIHIVNHVSGFLSTTHEELYYLPRSSYVIKSSVSNRFFSTNQFSVLGQMAKKEKTYF